MPEITDKHFKECLNHIAATPEGQAVLFILMEDCHWNKTIVSTEKPKVTQYYAARRGVYGGLRQHIRPEYLKSIEFDHKRKADEKENIKTEARTKARQDRVASRGKRGVQA